MDPVASPVPVRITHALPEREKIILIDWELGNTCNYRCSYCPAGIHDGSVPWLGFPDVLRAARSIVAHAASQDRRAHFQFSGGEPTLYPSIRELLTALGDGTTTVSLISNGSRSLHWWESITGLIEAVTLSHHIEFVSFNRFRAVATHLASCIRTNINITMLPHRFDECLDRARLLRAECPAASIVLKPLRIGFGSELYPYSAKQIETMRASDAIANPAESRFDPVRGAMSVEYSDGSTQNMEAGDFLLFGLNRWFGWCCYAGIDLFAIDARGQLFRGQCRQGGAFAHVTDKALRFPDAPIICRAERCACYSDIMTPRFLGSSGAQLK